MNILCIGAHPDDIELGCGGMLIKSAKVGHRVFMYVATRGSASGDPEQRTHESINAANYIGAERLWVDRFEDSKLAVSSKLINHLEYVIHRANPDLILTHATDDYHHDHRAIAEATLEAGRNSQNIFAYEIPLTKHFNPQMYYDITDVLDEKVELIKLFESQRHKLFTKDNAVTSMANYRASQNRLNGTMLAAESYEVLKMCLGKDFHMIKLTPPPLPLSVHSEVDVSGLLDHMVETKYSKVDAGKLTEAALNLLTNRESAGK